MSAFSLYVHIPYCQSKCPYCDFNSYAAARWPEVAYTDALVAELEHYAADPAWQGAVQTIFFGGGTPSLFAPTSIARILDAVRRHFELTVDSSQSTGPAPPATANSQLSIVNSIETTLEANPGTVDLDTLRSFRAAGVNRISFGVQSFHALHLARLGRIHTGAQAICAIEAARRAGFDNLNLDLIFAVPGQTLAEWEADLAQAVAPGPDHLSAYNLTYEEGTAFHAMRAKGQLQPAAEETECAMFARTQEILAAAGYAPYEISNYARPGRECRHNLNYWRGGAYLGVGAGAHSFTPEPFPGRRWSNAKDPNRYIERVASRGHARVSEEALGEAQARGEFVFLGLRTRDGFDGRDFAARFRTEFDAAFPHATDLARHGLLHRAGSRWQLTARGLMVADSVFATFL
jgi:oxygen-independent coproporphyrinogen-3 oxidase